MRNEVRLFLEEVCFDLCRFHHIAEEGVAPEDVRVHREVFSPATRTFSDLRVDMPGRPPYFVEIKVGYPADAVIDHVARKFGPDSPFAGEAERLILIVRPGDYPDWPALRARLAGLLHRQLALEVWDERELLHRIRTTFGVEVDSLEPGDLPAVRSAIDHAKWRYAFGTEAADTALESALLWHFGFWTLHRLHTECGLAPSELLKPGRYDSIAIVVGDLSSFSAYVRDTPDYGTVRHCLSAFYSLARTVVQNAGGMMYQFVGDEVIGLFGFPRPLSDPAGRALECAAGLLEIGNSVSEQWQREIDRVQGARGVHVGIALGELTLMPLRPFTEQQVAFIGDALNLAARLTTAAGPSEIVVSNHFHQALPAAARRPFSEHNPIEAKNVGRVRCWRVAVPEGESGILVP